MLVISALAGAYIVATFTSTGLAKLRRRKVATIGLISEGVIPGGLAYITVLCISAIELTIAILVITAISAFMVGLLTACLFLTFGIYRILSTVITGRVACSCAGVAHGSKVNASTISGAVFASLIQAAIAFAWAFSPASSGEQIELFLAFVATIPFAVFCIGLIPTRGKSSSDVTGSAVT